MTLPVATALAAQEAIIERGLHTFVEVGTALAIVRDERLYKVAHDSFEAYCSERWGLSRKRAYDMVAAAEVVSVLSPIGDTPPPARESQARELAPLRDNPAAMTEAWTVATERAEADARPVTARDVRQAVQLVAAPEAGPMTHGEVEQAFAKRSPAVAAAIANRDGYKTFDHYIEAAQRLNRARRDLDEITVGIQAVGRESLTIYAKCFDDAADSLALVREAIATQLTPVRRVV